jgi:hypothetical protein
MLGDVFMSRCKEWRDSGGFIHKQWREDFGLLHRKCGPAQIICRPDGSPHMESFWLHGNRHNHLGPAVIIYNIDGSIMREEFCLDGEFLGFDEYGFWKLWGNLTHEQRQDRNILKYLVRYS